MTRSTQFTCYLLASFAVAIAATGAFAQSPSEPVVPTGSESTPPPSAAPVTPTIESQPPSDGMGEVASSKSPWRFELYGWGWFTGATGSVGVRRLSADIDASLADIIDASDSILALSGRAEVGYGKFAGYVDGFYADLGMEDQSGPPGFADVDVTSQELIVDFGLMYRIGDWEPSGKAAANRRNMTLDLYAGGRYSDLDVTISPERLRDRSRQEDWVDPIIGARFTLPIGERWNLMANGDIGGFGVSSDFTWSTTAVFGYDFHIFKLPSTVYLGYRAIGWDYSTGSGADRFEWDIIQHGPLLGLSIQF